MFSRKERIFLCLLFSFVLIFFTFFSELVYINQAGSVHLSHVINYANSSFSSIPTSFPPLINILLLPFSNGERYWKFFGIFLFGVLIPFLLAVISRNAFAPIFYFGSSTLFTVYLEAAHLGEGLLIVFLLGLLAFENIFQQLGLLFVGSLSHSWAVVVLPLTWFTSQFNHFSFINNFFVFLVKSKWFRFLDSIFSNKYLLASGFGLLFISPFFPTDFKLLLFLLYFIVAFFYSFEGFVSYQKPGFVLMMVASFFAQFLVESRAFNLFYLLLGLGLTYRYSVSSQPNRWLFIFVMLGLVFFSHWVLHVNVPLDFDWFTVMIPESSFR